MITIPQLLRERARAAPEREFLRFEGAGLTVGEVEERTSRWAEELAALGVEANDRAALMLPNGLEFPVAWLSVVKAGAVVVPVNPGLGESDLAHVLNDSGARLLIADPAQTELLASVAPSCPGLELVCRLGAGDPRPVPSAGWEGCRLPDRSSSEATGASDTIVTIQYTSGTTGHPKGCLLTHEYWMGLAEMARELCDLGPDDVALTAQPFYYMDAVWNTILCLDAGLPLVILPRFSASTFWESVKQNGVTFFYCIGTMPLFLLKRPENPETERGHRVRRVLCSGIPPQHHARLEDRYGCPWREVYGSTELGGVLAVPFADEESVGTGAMGGPVEGRETMVSDETGAAVPPGTPGELLVRGGATMVGYHGLPDETARWKRDGWARTGDLVVEDERGYYRIVGRLKEMIRRAGENIAAAEVEAVLCDHPAVRAAACVAVPDEERGEEVKAFVQLIPDDAGGALSADDLAAYAGRKLAGFKVPRYIEFVKEFPLTPSHRVAKQQLIAGRPDLRSGSYDTLLREWI